MFMQVYHFISSIFINISGPGTTVKQGSSMSSSLNVRLFLTRVQKTADWFMLGVYLGVPNEELNSIATLF